MIVNYRSSQYLRRAVASLHGTPIFSIVVVNNDDAHSEREELDRIASLDARVRVCHSPENVGFGPAINMGVRIAEPDDNDVVWILNPDVIVMPGCAERLLARFDDFGVGIVGPAITTGPKRTTVWYCGGRFEPLRGRTVHEHYGEDVLRLPESPFVTTFMTGAACMVRATVWRELGGFREDLFLYWEDADLSQRALELGVLIVVEPRARVWHAEGASSSTAPGHSETYFYYMQRNRVVVCSPLRGMAGLLFGRGARETARLLFSPISQEEGRVAKARAGVRGLVAGMWHEVARRAGADNPKKSGPSIGGVLRYYKNVRTAHLERLQEESHATLLYAQENYDMERSVRLYDARAASPAQVVEEVALRRPAILELNEPGMVRAWPQVGRVLSSPIVKRRRRDAARPMAVTAYAIENLPVERVISHRFPGSRVAARWLSMLPLRWLVARYDRLAFGTEMSRQLYESYMSGGFPRGLSVQTISALPSPDPAAPRGPRGPHVLFVGTGDERKGLPQLLRAWIHVAQSTVDARLTVMVPSGVVDVPDAVHASVEVRVAPLREEVLAAFREAKVVVLFSQPTAYWREQVGLPIVEGLAAGCIIVASEETGLASELRSLGHVVLAADAPPIRLAAGIEEALQSPFTVDELLSRLPIRDGRSRARAWLNEAVPIAPG